MAGRQRVKKTLIDDLILTALVLMFAMPVSDGGSAAEVQFRPSKSPAES